MADEIKLGETYRDTITGFEGVVTSRHEYISGCVRYQLERGGEDGKPQLEDFDEQRLVKADSGEEPEPTARTGGPESIPAETRAPRG